MMLRERALARGPLAVAPRSATGLAIRTEIAQSSPAALATTAVGTKVPRGVHRAGASVGRGHRIGSHGKGRLGMCRLLLTQGAMGLLRQTRKRFGFVGALTSWLTGRGWPRL